MRARGNRTSRRRALVWCCLAPCEFGTYAVGCPRTRDVGHVSFHPGSRRWGSSPVRRGYSRGGREGVDQLSAAHVRVNLSLS
ncbi:hypothetical protein QBC39DRAFT_184897 [Podospora conica]|nr:hypothetical protein QBC39DRAFT_184897 [Schizothecium conicum]